MISENIVSSSNKGQRVLGMLGGDVHCPELCRGRGGCKDSRTPQWVLRDGAVGPFEATQGTWVHDADV